MAAVTRKNLLPIALAALAVLIVLPAAILIGATSDNSGTSVEPNPRPNIRAVAAFPARPENSTIVRLKDLAFQPSEVAVSPGRMVVFENADASQHDIVIDHGRIESGPMDPGAVFTWVPDRTGTFTLGCRIHPQMGGTITVQ